MGRGIYKHYHRAPYPCPFHNHSAAKKYLPSADGNEYAVQSAVNSNPMST